jgi:hydroxylaminobenzene mutase
VQEIRIKLAKNGAWLFFIGIVTGLWTAAVLTHKVQVAKPQLALAAHLNGVIGGLWLIGVAWTLEFLKYDEKRLNQLAMLMLVPAWANWAVTTVASVLGVSGLEYTRDLNNNVIAALLQALVVLPTLAGSAMWAWGFSKKR